MQTNSELIVFDRVCKSFIENVLSSFNNREKIDFLIKCTSLQELAKEHKYSLSLIDRSKYLSDAHPIVVIPYTSRYFPDALRYIDNSPALLFARGDVEILNRNSLICVIGSRLDTPYGAKVVRDLVTYLKRRQPVIVSGLARGIDALAHRAALQHELLTIAVMGTGVDICYPKLHQELYQQILKQGCVVSEFVPGTPPLRQNFPVRNRILSGLSAHVVIVEAGEKSGTMITAGFAADQGKEVWVIPNSIYAPKSRGCHKLIEQGARILYDFHSLYAELPVSNSEYLELLLYIQAACPEFSEIVDFFGVESAEMRLQLSQLEVMNLVERQANCYCLTEKGLSLCQG